MNPLDLLAGDAITDPSTVEPAYHPADRYDPRDAPGESGLPAELAADVIDFASEPMPPRPAVPVAVLHPVPTRPAAGRLVVARTLVVPTGATTAQLLGLAPGVAQAQGIAYTEVRNLNAAGGASLSIASDESALPGQRYTLPPGEVVQLPGIPGVYGWALAADVSVSVLVVGV